MQPRSASFCVGGMVGPLRTWLVALPGFLASPACGLWAGESSMTIGCQPSVFESLAEAQRPDCQPVMDSFMCFEFGAQEEPAGWVERMISFGERRSRLTGQRHGCVGQSRG